MAFTKVSFGSITALSTAVPNLPPISGRGGFDNFNARKRTASTVRNGSTRAVQLRLPSTRRQGFEPVRNRAEPAGWRAV